MGLSLQGRRVLLTGASGGIGTAVARSLHRRGATVVLSGRRADVLERLRAELGDRAEALPADLAYPGEVASLPERAGVVDVLVSNAGLPGSGAITDFEPEQLDRALDVNLRAPLHLARALIPGMVERGGGHLVFVSSLNGKVGSPGSALYSATKFGVRGMAHGLREDLSGTGVGVSVVYPGFIRDAGMFHDAGVRLPRGVGTRSPEQVAEALARGIEKGRLEVDVAPLLLRLGAKAAALAPAAMGSLQRRMGGADVADQFARGQSGKR